MTNIIEDEKIRKTHREPAKEGSEEERLQHLRDKWFQEYEDIIRPPPLELPPWREVNHAIPLIDEGMKYKYRPPRCPDVVKEELTEKINKYVSAGWWKRTNAQQAAPLLCVAKKSGKLRTVVDARQRNDNTIKDVTPLPDQDQIRMDVARAKYRSKIDLSDAYEQVRIELADIWKTAFATTQGTFISFVMQQGDCNAPATFQRLMMTVLREFVGRFVHVYLDDIFVFSDSIEEHERHLKMVFDKLREVKLYLSKAKLDLYSKRMDCLGHIIDDRGLHADADKMSRIHDWRTPRSYNEVQRFLGLVNYLAQFMLDITAYTSPLSDMEHNDRPFVWRPLHQKCFDLIKNMACKAPILKPIDPRINEPIWLICDASIYGIGAMYGQGQEWRTCRPAGFLSRKFSSAQRAYHTYEQEALAILEGLMKWEDKLLGRKFTVVTDHKALEFFKNIASPSGRQIRWLEYMARFNYSLQHVPGKDNKVADCLSRYYENDNADDFHPAQDYVNADVRLDPDWEDLKIGRIIELSAGRITRSNPQGLEPRARDEARHLTMAKEPRTVEAQEMAQAATRAKATADELPEPLNVEPEGEEPHETVWEALANGPSLRKEFERRTEFMTFIKNNYGKDKVFAKIIANPGHYKTFDIREGFIYTMNRNSEEVLCVPRLTFGKRTTTQILIDHAHTTLGHFGNQKTSEYLRRWFWWPRMGTETEKFCISCAKCQVSKPRNHLKAGLLHSLPISTEPWRSVAMDFLGPFPRVDGMEYDYLWVIVCRCTSMVHLVPIRTTHTSADLAGLYVKEIVRLHGLPESIVSDRDPKFTSKFWRELHRLMGTKLLMSTAFHPQTDGLSERTIRSINQILRATVNTDQLNWIEKIPLTEFALNSAVSATTGYAPFELNYGYLPKTIAGISTDTEFAGVKEFAERAKQFLESSHDAIIESRINQTHYANKHRREEPHYEVGDLVYLSTKNLTIPKGRARKLVPKFIGPYKILEENRETSSYKLELPENMSIHPTFHVEVLRRHEPNDDNIFPHRDARAFYDVGNDEEVEWRVEEIDGHRWNGNRVEFHVRWTHDDATWESYTKCNTLSALDEYLRLQGVRHWKALSKL